MNSFQGFLSYVHKDDEAESGRITQLAKDLVAQYELLTGESIELFLDKDALQWGDKWRDKIDESLSSVVFFIPVITPRYFLSPECRREFQFFARKADGLGIKELVLPLLYVQVPSLLDENSHDDLVKLVQLFQWVDWSDLRFEDVKGTAYRKSVSLLAAKLVDANKRYEQLHVVQSMADVSLDMDVDGEEPLGLIDKLANAESVLPEWNGTLHLINEEVIHIGEIIGKATSELNNVVGIETAKPFAYRSAIARNLAGQLLAPVDRVFALSNKFATQLHDVDEGFRIIIKQGIVEVASNPALKQDICLFFGVVKLLVASMNEGLNSMQEMMDAIAKVENISRDLRPIFRRLRQGIAIMIEGREVSEIWVKLINDSNVEC